MTNGEPTQLHIAGWGRRFWAWLIDVIVVGAAVNALSGAIGIVSLWSMGTMMGWPFGTIGGLNGLGFWLYWTLMEGYNGQSIGKLVLNLEVTDREGDPIEYGAAAIESFGKAFLLPIDVIVGVLVYEDKKLRLFNRLSETIVIETEASSLEPPEGVEYVMPGEG